MPPVSKGYDGSSLFSENLLQLLTKPIMTVIFGVTPLHGEERKMQGRTVPVAMPRHACAIVFRAISLTVLVLLLLAWSSSAIATGSSPSLAGYPAGQAALPEQAMGDRNADTESVTMSIPLDEDGVIDVEAPPMGVKIEKWDGDEVLLIVEKKKRTKPTAGPAPLDPVNIQVTRSGKNVRIEATGGSNWRENRTDLSFRIVLPDRDEVGMDAHKQTDDVTRLTSALWRTFHREALRWITH